MLRPTLRSWRQFAAREHRIWHVRRQPASKRFVADRGGGGAEADRADVRRVSVTRDDVCESRAVFAETHFG
jgi:hypothetical protein